MKRCIRFFGLWSAILSFGATTAWAQTNGSFSNGLTGWNTYLMGVVSAPTDPVTGNGFALFEEPATGKTGGGSLSQIGQDFYMPTSPSPQYLYFRYQFVHDVSLGPSPVPPDSFQAFLLDAADGSRLVLADSDPPDFTDLASLLAPFVSEPLFYEDSNGVKLYKDTEVIIKSTPDPDGLTAVAIDVSALPSAQHSSIIFSLDSANNGVTSVVLLDDVATACPPGLCCASDGTIQEIDDDNPCTDDTCVNGIVSHEPVCGGPPSHCHTCRESSGYVVIMIDRTGSTNNDDLTDEKTAAKNLLDFFGSSSVRPAIAIGTFNGPCSPSCSGDPAATSRARMLTGSPTDQYGTKGPPSTGLYAQVDGITEGPDGSYTDVGKAIEVAAGALPDRNPETDPPNYIIVISDGWTNVESDGDRCSNACICSASRTWASDAATAAETGAKHATIIAVHYIGHGSSNCQNTPSNITSAYNFMKDTIATTTDYFFEGSNLTAPPYESVLICTFYDIVQVISCDDGNSSTVDCCRQGECYHGDAACQ